MMKWLQDNKIGIIYGTTGHTSRVLHMAMSPDGTTVVSAAADETLRLWKCFPQDVHKQKKAKTVGTAQTSSLRGNIR